MWSLQSSMIVHCSVSETEGGWGYCKACVRSMSRRVLSTTMRHPQMYGHFMGLAGVWHKFHRHSWDRAEISA